MIGRNHAPTNSVVVDVVRAVAARKDTDPTSLEPLANTIDPNALESLVSHVRETQSTEMTVSFTYSGFHVTVDESGEITVSEV
ncbi:HalOD1 output domain-containing protein [Natrialba sp. INN-245]|uniref:HalOD1 output domain-containing protein n=1 Tax=Natrialba sp. INN-245 TaxID=2690967 RepID=UPI0013128492|nr:HalOD1 output domain-containing protein [Natrialba sp. INN-245]MWV40943.1 hypothetical protein [Natrialba sp. INN-245]